MWTFIALVTLASMPVAGHMARARHRSLKAWVWAAAVVGPFAPLALCLLGGRGDRDARD